MNYWVSVIYRLVNEWFQTKHSLLLHYCSFVLSFLSFCPSTSAFCSLFWLNELQTITQMSKSLIINSMRWVHSTMKSTRRQAHVCLRPSYSKDTTSILKNYIFTQQFMSVALIIFTENSWDTVHHQYWGLPDSRELWPLHTTCPCLQSFNFTCCT